MRLLMVGTGPFGAPTFRGLFETRHDVVGLVTSPVRRHRGRKVLPASAARDVAHEHAVAIFDPEDVNTPQSQDRLRRFGADLLVVCDYGQILSADTLATARLGGVNLHGSLLPKYRGAAPVNWAIYHGETVSGVTVIHMTPKVDAGPCVGQVETKIEPEETAVELESRLSEMGVWLVRQALEAIEAGRIEALPQDPSVASKAPRLRKSDGNVDWSRAAAAIKNQVRALEPWPKTYTFWHRQGGSPVRLILGPVSAVESSPADAAPGTVLSAVPGTVLSAAGATLLVAAGRGAVQPRTIQPAGKRTMTIEEFLRGNHVRPGDLFGPE